LADGLPDDSHTIDPVVWNRCAAELNAIAYELVEELGFALWLESGHFVSRRKYECNTQKVLHGY